MISWKNFSSSIGLSLLLSLFLIHGCGGSSFVNDRASTPLSGVSLTVFPPENLSGASVPLKIIRESLVGELRTRGFQVVTEAATDEFLARNRIRYTSGIEETTARVLKEEAGVDAVLLTSVELYSDALPPKIALVSRLVSSGQGPHILWSDGVGLTGDQSPGLLSLGLVEDPGILLKKAVTTLVKSMDSAFESRGGIGGTDMLRRPLPPKVAYRAGSFPSRKKRLSIAVLPFLNGSERRNGGDILALQFVRALRRLPDFEVIEPGLIRNVLLRERIIMADGVSLPQVGTVAAALDADLILTGSVLDYQDYEGAYGAPRVGFTVQLIDGRDQLVVWSSVSYNRGDDGVFFFDIGKSYTAQAMAARMVESIGNRMAGR
jgi:TolB-like protein